MGSDRPTVKKPTRAMIMRIRVAPARVPKISLEAGVYTFHPVDRRRVFAALKLRRPQLELQTGKEAGRPAGGAELDF